MSNFFAWKAILETISTFHRPKTAEDSSWTVSFSSNLKQLKIFIKCSLIYFIVIYKCCRKYIYKEEFGTYVDLFHNQKCFYHFLLPFFKINVWFKIYKHFINSQDLRCVQHWGHIDGGLWWWRQKNDDVKWNFEDVGDKFHFEAWTSGTNFSSHNMYQNFSIKTLCHQHEIRHI